MMCLCVKLTRGQLYWLVLCQKKKKDLYLNHKKSSIIKEMGGTQEDLEGERIS
jgi:hypothetical protein